MSKTLVANPVAGLKGVPARIKLDKNSMTVSTGIIGKSQSFSYGSIQSVSFSGANSLTLSGSIIIEPYMGSSIKLLGFYKKQFEIVQQAVQNGGYDGDDEYTDSCDNDFSIGSIKEQKKGFFTKMLEEEKEEKNRIKDITSKVSDMEVDIKDEDESLRHLQRLMSIFDSNQGDDEGNDSREKKELQKAALAKFQSSFELFKISFPDSKYIPFFEQKVKDMNNLEVQKKKKSLKTNLIILAVFVGMLLIALILGNS